MDVGNKKVLHKFQSEEIMLDFLTHVIHQVFSFAMQVLEIHITELYRMKSHV